MESGEFFVHACTHFLYTFKKVCTKRVQMLFFYQKSLLLC